MKLYHQEPFTPLYSQKGWYVGQWNNTFPFPVGYADIGVDEPHVHSKVTEVYLIAKGTSQLRVEQETIELKEGDCIIIEPGEAHTFLSSSKDYFHFVFQYPGLRAEDVKADKQLIERSRLGL
jgi:mannose-6-phosphate isomerase-like protein (cupin superfamily)